MRVDAPEFCPLAWHTQQAEWTETIMFDAEVFWDAEKIVTDQPNDNEACDLEPRAEQGGPLPILQCKVVRFGEPDRRLCCKVRSKFGASCTFHKVGTCRFDHPGNLQLSVSDNRPEILSHQVFEHGSVGHTIGGLIDVPARRSNCHTLTIFDP